MDLRFPAPMRPGDRVAVTSPSSGVAAVHRARLEVAVRAVEARGYEVVVGSCMDGSGHVSAPAGRRADELVSMLTDPTIRAVVPPWGGETAIDLLPLIDWEAVRQAEPTWMVGFSDIATIITPLTTLTGLATVHGNNLMDTPYAPPDGLVSWLDVVTMPTGRTFTQTSSGWHRASGFDDFAVDPGVESFTLDSEAPWTRLDGSGDVDVSGRLVGGCIETLTNLAGTPYADLSAFARSYAPDGLLVYVEAAEHDAFTICRNLHGMRLAGFFDHAAAVLVGHTAAPDSSTLSQREAVVDALGALGVPMVANVECGHTAPYLPIVNGALGRLELGRGLASLTQTLA